MPKPDESAGRGWTPGAVEAGLSAWGVVLPDEAECAEVAARLTLLIELLQNLTARLGTDPRTLVNSPPFPRDVLRENG